MTKSQKFVAQFEGEPEPEPTAETSAELKAKWFIYCSSSKRGQWYMLIEWIPDGTLFGNVTRYELKTDCVADAKGLRKHLELGKKLTPAFWNEFKRADSIAKARSGIQVTL